MNIAIILGEFHKDAMNTMLTEAQETCKKLGLNIVSETWVPGSLEAPLMLNKMLQGSDVDGVIILGIIERGQTKHGLVMGQSVTSKILDIQIEHNKPVGMGILGPEILDEQIEPRLAPYARAATEAVHKMLLLLG